MSARPLRSREAPGAGTTDGSEHVSDGNTRDGQRGQDSFMRPVLLRDFELMRNAAAEEVFRRHGGILRTSRAIALGVHPRTLYALERSGRLVRLSRGVYRLSGRSPLGEPDLVTVALRVPRAVVCLVSALHFHGITTQIPHAVDIALPRGGKPPRLDFPPVRVHQFAREALAAGVETHVLDGVPVRISGPEKTVADCFKFRNRIGLDVAIEALRMCRSRKRSRPAEILRFARVCRVERVVRPYLEAMV